METPNFFAGSYFGATECQRYCNQNNSNSYNQFAIDDLLNFSNEDDVLMNDAFCSDTINHNSCDFSSVSPVGSCNSSVSGSDTHFSGNVSCRSFSDSQFSGSELCVPYDDLVELEWLSGITDESFSNDELQNLQLISPTTITPTTFWSETAAAPPPNFFVPVKPRSKRSRAAPGDWSSRLLLFSRPKRTTSSHKCLHCGSDKTPQWRTGPLGPKTLCNACGVRYKSGRLVPEYRPAASPTYVSAKHSNSHRKVMELRRQKFLA